MKPSGDSSAEPLQVRRECGIIIFKVMNGKKKTKYCTSQGYSQIWRWDKVFYKQAKTKGVQHHETSFIIKVKRTSLSRKENIAIRNVKITKKKSQWYMKHRGKVVYQQFIKLTGRLKKEKERLAWWSSSCESAHQCRDTDRKSVV